MSNPLLPGVDHSIPLPQAREMTKRFRDNMNAILLPDYKGKIFYYCETFNREGFDVLLQEADCAGIRIYFGMDESLHIKVLAVGVDSANHDILPSEQAVNSLEGGNGDGDDGTITETGRPCPDFCPDGDSLMGP